MAIRKSWIEDIVYCRGRTIKGRRCKLKILAISRFLETCHWHRHQEGDWNILFPRVILSAVDIKAIKKIGKAMTAPLKIRQKYMGAFKRMGKKA